MTFYLYLSISISLSLSLYLIVARLACIARTSVAGNGGKVTTVLEILTGARINIVFSNRPYHS